MVQLEILLLAHEWLQNTLEVLRTKLTLMKTKGNRLGTMCSPNMYNPSLIIKFIIAIVLVSRIGLLFKW